jgi:hypothetical protein
VTSKTSPKITSTVEQTLAELREGDRRRDSLVWASSFSGVHHVRALRA